MSLLRCAGTTESSGREGSELDEVTREIATPKEVAWRWEGDQVLCGGPGGGGGGGGG